LSGCALYMTIEPCPMCCGAAIASGVVTLVTGASYALVNVDRWGRYEARRLLELAGYETKVQLMTGVRADECRRVWFRLRPEGATSREASER